MDDSPRICVIIPVYNHSQTVQAVIRGAKAAFPVIVVDDGSTDDTPVIVAVEDGITPLTLPHNQGKGAALKAGFDRAAGLGFTHAITIDADGQHSTGALAEFATACGRHSDAFITGVRDLKTAGAPLARRLSNALSSLWFRFETGVPLADTQCGFRCYPLAAIRRLRVNSRRYAYELEVLVKAAWAGIPIVAHPVTADYAAPTSRLSHFDPWWDMAHISWVHLRLSTEAFCIPAPLRMTMVQGILRDMPRGRRVRTVVRHLLAEHTETPGRLALAVGLGLLCGLAPVWGFQMLVAAALAHRFRLNKAIAVAASGIAFPLAAPWILAVGQGLGRSS